LGLTLLLFVFGVSGDYVLEQNWAGANFFNGWQFWTGDDPTHGTVDYVSQQVAQQAGLINTNVNGRVYIGADMTHTVSTKQRGRQSVRITTQQTYNSGLFIIDLAHMPTGCGTWPAWWIVGPNWPNGGEIDIIEGVNLFTAVQTTLHTNDGCSMAGEDKNSFTGTWVPGTNGQPATNCNVKAPNQANNHVVVLKVLLTVMVLLLITMVVVFMYANSLEISLGCFSSPEILFQGTSVLKYLILITGENHTLILNLEDNVPIVISKISRWL